MALAPAMLREFAPDADPLSPGVLVDMNGFVPSIAGMKTIPGLVEIAIPPNGDDPVVGAITAVMPDGTRITIAATRGQIWRLDDDTGTWQPMIDPILSPPITETSRPWRFDTFGVYIVAVNGDEVLVSTSGGQFERVGNGAPPSSICQSAENGAFFLIRSDSNEVWGSLAGPLGLWNPPLIQNETFVNPRNEVAGPITAAHRLRSNIAIYKRQSLVIGVLSNPPEFYDFGIITEESGTPSQEAVVNLGDRHLYMGDDDFYMFDGSTSAPIPNRLRLWFFNRLDHNYIENVQARYDRSTGVAYWHFPSTDAMPAGTLDEWIAYNVKERRWAHGFQMVERVLQPDYQKAPVLTYEQLERQYPFYRSFPDLAYKSLTATGKTAPVPALFLLDHKLWGVSGPSKGGYLTHRFGNERMYSSVSQITPRFARDGYPTDNSSTLTMKRTAVDGKPIPSTNAPSDATEGERGVLSADGTYDVVQSARVHQARYDFTANTEIVAVDLDIQDDGED